MKISTKGRYAVMAMIELAINDKKGLLPLAELSLSHEISISYLEQLFSRLRAHDLVAGVRGPRGGYRLSRPASDISIAQIVKAADDKADPYAFASADTSRETRDITNTVWISLSKQIYEFLNGISLAESIFNKELTYLFESHDGTHEREVTSSRKVHELTATA
ncbi:MAG: Rrf2 family transcriptional regulator iron-sulfur cluster assembly transcription factor [Halothiobacillaceae bacterium]|nr:MAG: Rrf2 family transcriptional regulator iron-sulfur cluster assembly transcription factor [Halothiobacillaceae bacterium]